MAAGLLTDRCTMALRSFAVASLVLALLAGGPVTFGQSTGRVPSAIVGGVHTYTVRPGDSLSLIGARYGVGAATLARQNARQPRRVLHPGEQLQIDNRHVVPARADETIVINIPQRHLFYFATDGALRAHYPVGLGRPDWQTPVGAFEITEAERDPTWDVPKSIQEEMRREGRPVIERMPPCPENPLGRFWLRLSIGGVGIHGTNAPASVYTFATHGCIRLHPDDIAELFAGVTEGERGRLIYEPVLLARLPDGRIFAEVHRDVYRRAPPPLTALRALARDAGLIDAVDWARAEALARQADGIATEITREFSALMRNMAQPDRGLRPSIVRRKASFGRSACGGRWHHGCDRSIGAAGSGAAPSFVPSFATPPGRDSRT